MDTTGAKLAVDIGPVTTVAAMGHAGHRSAVVFGDSVTLPTPTMAGDPGGDLLTAVVTARADAIDSVSATLTEHLRAIAAQAGPVDHAVITAPPSWGPRHHETMIQAGQAAGLTTVEVVSEAAAVATHSFRAAPQDATVLICQLGQRASHLTVVQRQGNQWVRIATQPMPQATGDRLDTAIAQLVLPAAPINAAVLGQLAAVRQRLADGQPAAVMMPSGADPIVVSPEMVDEAARPLRQAVADAMADIVDAAGVDAHRLHGKVLYGDSAAALTPSPQANSPFDGSFTTPADGRLAAAYGALDSISHDRSASTQAVSPAAAWGRRGRSLLAPIAAGIAGALMQWQTFDVVSRNMPPDIYRLPTDYEKLQVFFDTAEFATAGWALTLACLAIGRNLAAALLIGGAAADRANRRQAGRIYAFAAVVGLAIAMLQGLLAQAILGGPDGLAPPYLRSAVAAAAVPATIAIIIGLTAPWLTGSPRWTDRIHHPTTAVVLAAAGILAATARANGMPIDGLPTFLAALLGLFGAGLLGVAIALTLVADKLARLILGTIMGVACMIIVGVSNLHSVIVLYLVCVAVWYVRRGSRIVVDTLPAGWWRRLGLIDQTPR